MGRPAFRVSISIAADSLPGRGASLWLETADGRSYEPLDGDATADVAILGGGIVGLTAALLLGQAGKDVILLEADRVAHGVSGHTTAKLTSLHGTVYEQLTKHFGEEGARAYGAANEAGIDFVEAQGIECDFERLPNFTYAESAADVDTVRAETRAAQRAGLSASFTTDVPLPFPVAGAVRFEDQAQFHPVKYLYGLAERTAAAGVRIHERSRATGVRDGEPCRVETERGAVTAERVVVATHFPFLDRGFYFARMHQERSYAITVKAPGHGVEAMHLSAGQPTRSLRLWGDHLLVGGEGHKTGQDGSTAERYRRLEAWARERFQVESVEQRWSAQDPATLDRVPYVGRFAPGSKGVFVGTGFAKWGLAHGTAAGILLSDLLLGRENDWAALHDPARVNPRASASDFAKENANVGVQYLDHFRRADTRDLSDVAKGGAAIVRIGRQKVAVHRDDSGKLHAVSPVCTHLYCQLRWNDGERSWDCPCHGSRFDPDGRVLQGPAVKDLERKDLDA